MVKRKLLTKPLIAAFSVIVSMSMTACSFDFSSTENVITNQIKEDITSIINDKINDFIDNPPTNNVDTYVDNFKDTVTSIVDDIAEHNLNDEIQLEKATLVRVVDGDTLVVEINNEDFKVRLIGVNTPESVAPPSYWAQNSEEGANASAIVKDFLKNTKTVYLQKDTSDTDKYGRLLRYVWLDLPKDEKDINEIRDKMLNAMLVDSIQFDWGEPVAEPTTYVPDTTYSDVFNELYNEAIGFERDDN